MEKATTVALVGAFLAAAVSAVALGAGYVMNIVSLVTATETTGWIVARAFGIAVPFLGGVLGWF